MAVTVHRPHTPPQHPAAHSPGRSVGTLRAATPPRGPPLLSRQTAHSMGDAAAQPADAVAELKQKLKEHKRKLKERVAYENERWALEKQARAKLNDQLAAAQEQAATLRAQLTDAQQEAAAARAAQAAAEQQRDAAVAQQEQVQGQLQQLTGQLRELEAQVQQGQQQVRQPQRAGRPLQRPAAQRSTSSAAAHEAGAPASKRARVQTLEPPPQQQQPPRQQPPRQAPPPAQQAARASVHDRLLACLQQQWQAQQEPAAAAQQLMAVVQAGTQQAAVQQRLALKAQQQHVPGAFAQAFVQDTADRLLPGEQLQTNEAAPVQEQLLALSAVAWCGPQAGVAAARQRWHADCLLQLDGLLTAQAGNTNQAAAASSSGGAVRAVLHSLRDRVCASVLSSTGGSSKHVAGAACAAAAVGHVCRVAQDACGLLDLLVLLLAQACTGLSGSRGGSTQPPQQEQQLAAGLSCIVSAAAAWPEVLQYDGSGGTGEVLLCRCLVLQPRALAVHSCLAALAHTAGDAAAAATAADGGCQLQRRHIGTLGQGLALLLQLAPPAQGSSPAQPPAPDPTLAVEFSLGLLLECVEVCGRSGGSQHTKLDAAAVEAHASGFAQAIKLLAPLLTTDTAAQLHTSLDAVEQAARRMQGDAASGGERSVGAAAAAAAKVEGVVAVLHAQLAKRS